MKSRLSDLLLSNTSGVEHTIVLDKALQIAEKLDDKEIQIHHLTMAAAECCGFGAENPNAEVPRVVDPSILEPLLRGRIKD